MWEEALFVLVSFAPLIVFELALEIWAKRKFWQGYGPEEKSDLDVAMEKMEEVTESLDLYLSALDARISQLEETMYGGDEDEDEEEED